MDGPPVAPAMATLGLDIPLEAIPADSGGNLLLVPGAGPGRLAALSAVEFTLGRVASIAFSRSLLASSSVSGSSRQYDGYRLRPTRPRN